MAGNPVEWTDWYILSDMSPAETEANRQRDETLDFAQYEDRVTDLTAAFSRSATREPSLSNTICRAKFESHFQHRGLRETACDGLLSRGRQDRKG